MIDLSSNENPYPPSPMVYSAVALGLNQLNRYIGAEEIAMLRKALADYCEVSEECIIAGPGTDFLIEKIVGCFAMGRDVIILNPSFFKAINRAKHIARRIKRLQLIPPSFRVEWDSVLGTSALVIIDHPNNPTGKCIINRAQLIGLLESGNSLVIIDEACFEFSGETFVDLVEDYPNLAIIRTLDKAFALAGLKVSYLIAGKFFQNKFSSFEWLINRPACAAAVIALEDKAYAKNSVDRIVHERERMRYKLEELGMDVAPSQANFLLVNSTIPDLALELRKKDILIGDLSGMWLSDYYRISVGNREEINALIKAIEKLSN